MTFSEYVIEWFQDYLKNEENDQSIEELFECMGYSSDDLEDEQDTYNFLMNLEDGEMIWRRIFSYGSEVKQACLDIAKTDTEELLCNFYKDAVSGLCKKYDFVEEFIEDIAGNCIGYDNPVGFFKDLVYGGCAAGTVGSLIYNSDCKKIYIKYIDSMEAYVEDTEEELGCELKNEHKYLRYVFVCWTCMEQLAYAIASILWPEEM